MTAAPPSHSISIDVSNTLDSSRLSGLQRLAVRTVDELGRRSDVELTLLDGRSGSLRRVVGGRRRLQHHFDRAPGEFVKRVETRVARRVPMGPPWAPLAGDWLVDIEPSWHGPQGRAELLPSVRTAGVRTAAVVPDLLPIRCPE